MVYLCYVLSIPELLLLWENVPCNAPPRYKNIKKQFLVMILWFPECYSAPGCYSAPQGQVHLGLSAQHAGLLLSSGLLPWWLNWNTAGWGNLSIR